MKRLLPLLVALAALYWWTQDSTVSVSSGDGSVAYVIEYAAGAKSGERLPMLVALHGNGDSPQNFYRSGLRNLQVPARIVLLKGPLSYADGDAWPWTDADMVFHRDAVAEAVSKLSAKFPTRGKPLLLGFSGGGSVAYDQALFHAELYSHIFPISGTLGMLQSVGAERQAGAEVSAYHGRADRVVPFADGQIAVGLLKEHAVPVSLTPFAGGHLEFFGAQNGAILKRVDEALRNLQQS